MQTETRVEWARVEEVRSAPRCIGVAGEPRCDDVATWRMTWQSPAMAAPAFWYFCDRCRKRQVDRNVLVEGNMTAKGMCLEAAALLRSAAHNVAKAQRYLERAGEVSL